MKINCNHYIYDNTGNLIKDVSEEIDTIVWNVYGKIERVVRTSTSSKSDLEFRYDAMGNRICKIVKPRAGAGVLSQDNWTYTYYLRDASGNVIAVYDRDFEQQPSDATFTDELSVKEQHLYGSSRVGIRSVDEVVSTTTYNYSSTASNGTLVGTYVGMNSIAASTTNWSHTLKQKAYELSNHLGNVLVTVSDARTANNSGGTITTFNAVVESAQDYYAFGSTMVGRSVSGDYRYGFNDQEKDPEIAEGIYTADYWEYDSKLGRRWNTDPIPKVQESPYAVFANNPIWFVDPTGADSAEYTACGGGPEVSSAYDDGSSAAVDFSSTYSGGADGTVATPDNKYIPYSTSHSDRQFGWLALDVDDGGPGKSAWGAFQTAYYYSSISMIVRPGGAQQDGTTAPSTVTLTGMAMTGNATPGIFIPSATATMYVDGVAQSTQGFSPNPNGSLYASPEAGMGASASLGSTTFTLPKSGTVTIKVEVGYSYYDQYSRTWVSPVTYPLSQIPVSYTTTFTVYTTSTGVQAPGPFIQNHTTPDLTH